MSPFTRSKTSTPFQAAKELTNRLVSDQAMKGAIKRTATAVEAWGRGVSLQKLMTRRWKAGDVYAPHDLSPQEMKKWRMRQPRDRDVFDALAINPLNEYKVDHVPRCELQGFGC